MFTPEQQEAMAAFLREIDGLYHDDCATTSTIAYALRKHGIWGEYDDLALWLAPPDDSVALDHPQAGDCAELELRRSQVSGKFRYMQWLNGGGADMTDWHPTEEAARKEWNAICRRAAK